MPVWGIKDALKRTIIRDSDTLLFMKRSPLIYLLFFGSGITALIYEIVWTRMLTLVFGHTVFSVSVVLAAFMAGLGFGSYLFGVAIDRLSDSSSNAKGGESAPVPLLLYGWIEIGVFVLGGLLSLLFANFSAFYSWVHIGVAGFPAHSKRGSKRPWRSS